MTNSTIGYDRKAVHRELMHSLDGIRDVLTDCADEAERTGFYPERGWNAMHDGGLFRMKAARELGGYEADPVTQIEVIEEAARIDSSAGWTLFVGAGFLSFLSAFITDEALEDFMIDRRLPRVAGGIAPTGRAKRVSGGFEVTGRWQFGSGSAHAQWFSGNAVIEDDQQGPPVLGFLLPRDKVTLHDNWNTNALRGTGSQDLSVERLFVPDKHAFDTFAPPRRGGALFRIPLPGLVTNEHGAFALGVAQRSLDETAELAKSKARGYIQPRGVAARGKFRFDLGRADSALSAARSHLKAVNEMAWQAAVSDEPVGLAMQTELRCAAVYATDIALEVVRAMFRYAGAHSLYVGDVIERCLRDVQAAAQHGLVNDTAYESRGELILGLPDVAVIE